ncbi:PfkB domain protein [Paenibacillus curdlanolyticus YK9]|uniref:PfkB domain protein n=1 Tax=Paenibacillus curdlanolyticus YK9 TaxID=717606 RepID=E0I4Q0_9BACL|nr:sugar kinase [Paenibacillus curdlanolyticus]EFM12581.1 PfkB domain protein [Paenibacillus curdlanolyticus YK9]
MAAKRKRVAAFGEVMMRLQAPGYELLTQANTLHYSFSGTGVNVASALSRFGHEAYLVTRLPDNPLGDAAEAFLRKLGILTSCIERGGAYLGMYFLENGFGARPSRVTYSNRQASSFNTAPDGTYEVDQIAEQIDLIHFCGISLAMNDGVRAQMKALARAVKAKGGTVVFDCNYRPAHWGEGGYALAKPHYEEMLELADIAMMNERDAMLILGMPTAHEGREEQLADLLPQVARQYGINVLAGTHRTVNGDNTHTLRGFHYKHEAFVFSEPRTFSVYDRIGAGDAYASGIVHGELAGFSPEQTVSFAVASAVLAHTISGDTPMSSERDVLRAMTEAAGDVER